MIKTKTAASYDGVAIVAGTEIPYRRHAQANTSDLLAQAYLAALDEVGLSPSEVDGLGVASFTQSPDKAIDLAWKLGLSPRWFMDDSNGGTSGFNLLQHAARAIQCGDASVIVLVAGDHFEPADFVRLVENYNITTRDHLRPMGAGSPNSLFAMLTRGHMKNHGLERADYGGVAMAQRLWAQDNPNAVYRSPMSLDDYLAAPMVSDPLCRLDCVPVVTGANAIVLTAADHPVAQGRNKVSIRALHSRNNSDHQEGDGLKTGLAGIADDLWGSAGMGPDDIDLCSIYDDYPVMVLVQLADLGFIKGSVKDFIQQRLLTRKLPVNTSGGMLSAGQAGAACSLHGLVEVWRQLSGNARKRQVSGARTALVAGYGMIEYRYGMCSTALVLEGEK